MEAFDDFVVLGQKELELLLDFVKESKLQKIGTMKKTALLSSMRASIKAMNDYQAWENDSYDEAMRKNVIQRRKNAVSWVKDLYSGDV